MTINISSKIIAGIITLGVIAILFYSGPASAINLFMDIPKTNILIGSDINIMPSIEILLPELAEIDYLVLKINGINNPNGLEIECRFLPDGTAVSGCDGIEIEKIVLSENASNYGYGYGYKYDGPYGYGYGYGYGYFVGNLKYNITFNSNKLGNGTYSTEFLLYIKDKVHKRVKGSDITITTPTDVPPIKVKRCSIRAFDGSFNVDNQDFLNNKIKFYISTRDGVNIRGTGSLSGQKDRERFSYRFKILNVVENNNKELIVNVSGTYRIGRNGALKNIKEDAILSFDKVNQRIGITGSKLNIETMYINFMDGCDPLLVK